MRSLLQLSGYGDCEPQNNLRCSPLAATKFFCFNGKEDSSTSSATTNTETNTSGQTSGANSPSVVNGGAALNVTPSTIGNTGTVTTTAIAGNQDNSTKVDVGNGNTISVNPDSTQLIKDALSSLGNALSVAVSNRDVISPAGSTVTQTGTQTPTTGLVDSIKSFFSSSTVKLALIIAFPLVALFVWSIYRKKKT